MRASLDLMQSWTTSSESNTSAFGSRVFQKPFAIQTFFYSSLDFEFFPFSLSFSLFLIVFCLFVC